MWIYMLVMSFGLDSKYLCIRPLSFLILLLLTLVGLLKFSNDLKLPVLTFFDDQIRCFYYWLSPACVNEAVALFVFQ